MHVSLDSALGRQRRLNSVGESVLQIAPNAAAAYSLRSLTGGDPKVVRVRRASDNGERDFTGSEITSGEMVSWVNQQVIKPLDIQALEADGRTGDFLIAKAAYALRSLGTRQATLAATGDTVARANGKFVAQVRRSSDDALKSFTADEVTDGTLLAFVNEDVELFSNDFEANTSGFSLNTGGSNVAVRNTSDGFSGSGCLQLNLTSNLNTFSTVKTDTYMQDTDGVTYTVSFYAKAISGSANLVLKIGTTGSSSQQISFSENGGEWVKYSLTFVNNLGAGSGNRNQRILFAGSTSDTTEWRIDDFQIVQTTSNGFVKTWYDQSVTTQAGDTATGNHAVQATAGNQPKIVDAGSLIAGGLNFDGTAHQLTLSNTLGITSAASHFAVINPSGGGADTLFDNRDSGVDGYRIEATSSTKINFDWLSSDAEIDTISDQGLYYFNKTSSQVQSGANGGTLVTSSESGSVSVTTVPRIGARSFTSALNFFAGTINELIIYNSDQTDNRTAIEANIGEAYSITGIPAYDDEVDGFVETWYDQSGNSNDVTQATAGSQPKIVNAGSLVTIGGRASFKFDGSSDFLERETYTQGSLSQPNTFFSVAELDAYADENRKVYDGHVSTSRNMLQLNTAGNGQFAHFAGLVAATGEDADADRHLFTSLINGPSSDLRIDGTSKTTGNTASQAMTGIVIGANHDTADNFWDGDIQEIIIYNSNQSSTTTAVETNINSHYSIF